jgi:hypothetical protein
LFGPHHERRNRKGDLPLAQPVRRGHGGLASRDAVSDGRAQRRC